MAADRAQRTPRILVAAEFRLCAASAASSSLSAVGSIAIQPGNSNVIFAASGRGVLGVTNTCCGGVDALIPGAPHLVADIARRHPELKLIVDHLGVPRGSSGPAAFDHLPSLLALGAHPNVHVKATGVGDYALDPYPFRSLEATLRRVFDAFGPERMLWGSDLSRLHHSYLRCVTHFSESLSWLSSADLHLIMGGNICRLLGWQRH